MDTLYFIHQRIRISHEQCRFWPVLFLDVIIMKLIHQGLWQIEHWHYEIDWFIENKFRFFHVHCNKIFSEDCRSFIIRFRNKLFSWFIIRSESDIHPVSDVLHCSSKHWIGHEFEEIFLKLALSFCSKLCVQLDVRFQPCISIEWYPTANIRDLHPHLKKLFKIPMMENILALLS